MLLSINERRKIIARNSVFDCHLSPVRRQMAIKNIVSNNFFYLCSSISIHNVFDCCLSGVKRGYTQAWKGGVG